MFYIVRRFEICIKILYCDIGVNPQNGYFVYPTFDESKYSVNFKNLSTGFSKS